VCSLWGANGQNTLEINSKMSYQSYSSSSSGGAGFSSFGQSSGASFGGASQSFGSSSSSSGGNNIATDLLSMIGGGSSSGGSASMEFMSQIEQAILRSANPMEVSETEELTVIGQRGIWLNKQEVNAWRGDLNISEYKIYEDRNPQVIEKRYEQVFEYVQELAIRYLRPPTPPTAGEIVITMEPNVATGPAPPLIIRQAAARAATPEPLVLREAPPQPPQPIAPKRITISGKRNPPPPRKVVIERLAPLPAKPQNVIVERWLPYAEGGKRRVIFNKAAAAAAVANPRNVIVQWEEPRVNIRQEVKYLGVIRANPAEYVQRYGAELKVHSAFPKFVQDIATPSEVGQLAWNFRSQGFSYELEGNLEGFAFVNLDTEGLTEYRAQLMAKGIRDLGASGSSSSSSSGGVAAAASQIFDMIDYDRSGEIEVFEAERVVLKLNSQLKRSYGEAEVKSFFASVSGGASKIGKSAFLQAFAKLA
jgi:hypothetical protein